MRGICTWRRIRAAVLATLVTSTLAVAVGTASQARAASGPQLYVTSVWDGTVTPINTSAKTAGSPILFGGEPGGIAITPDGRTAYVADSQNGVLVPIDLATNTLGTPIPAGLQPWGVAITPDGTTAYVADVLGGGMVTPIDIATKTPGSPISLPPTFFGGVPNPAQPATIVITPNGKTAYVADTGNGVVIPINLGTKPPTPGRPIPVGCAQFGGMAISPNGKTVYALDSGTCEDVAGVIPIDVATNTPGNKITGVGSALFGIAITPDGKTAYVANEDHNYGNSTVSTIDLATKTVGVTLSNVGAFVWDIGISPDGKTAYVPEADINNNSGVIPIDVATNTPGPPIPATFSNTPFYAGTMAFTQRPTKALGTH